jgi:phosphoglycerol transferase MdoB-like AlkP superfamily enzyme
MMVKNPVFHAFSWKELLLKILIFLLFISISALFQRGGFQTRPLGLIDTGKDAAIQNAPLVSNTPFTLLKSFGKQQYEIKNYFQDLEEAELYYSPFVQTITPCSQYCYPVRNVIFIILEGFSPYLIYDKESNDYQGYCPFLNTLRQQSISFNGIANGRRTIEALPAIFSGIPVLLNQSYVESTFANNFTRSPVEVLKNHGYHTLFFHGAKNGSMNIESYCYSIGFKEYY